MQPIENGPLGAGSEWTDTGDFKQAGSLPIRAQAGSILQDPTDNTKYYWYGFDYDYQGFKSGFAATNTVLCYSSSDLAHWKREGSVASDASLQSYHGRPRVVYNSSTGKYVMVVEGPPISTGNTVCFLSSSSPTSGFKLQGFPEQVLNPNPNSNPLDPDGHNEIHQPGSNMGDHNIFVDTEGSAYLIAVCDDYSNVNGTLRINRLSSDYLTQSSWVADVFRNQTARREAPILFKRGSTYYVFTSRTTGWTASETEYSTAARVSGPWSPLKTVGSDPLSMDSYGTQFNLVIALSRRQAGVVSVSTCAVQPEAATYLFAGDRWSHRLGYGSGRTEWAPITWVGEVPTINHHDLFFIDAAAGTVDATAQNAGPPPVPREVTAQALSNEIRLHWTASLGATSYAVRRYPSIGGEPRILETGGTATSWTDSTAVSGTKYYYLISSRNAGGESPTWITPQVGATVGGMGRPAPPTGFTAVRSIYGVAGQICLSWNAVSGASSYDVSRSLSPTGPFTFIIPRGITAAPTPAQPLSDGGLVIGATYYYVVTAVNEGGRSADSAVAGCAVAPGHPWSVAAYVQRDPLAAVITWAGDHRAGTYRVKRSTDNREFSAIASEVEGSIFFDTTVTPGVTYYYLVTGVGAGVESIGSATHPSVTP
jgi:fibronectin type 3 domain-containing protein